MRGTGVGAWSATLSIPIGSLTISSRSRTWIEMRRARFLLMSASLGDPEGTRALGEAGRAALGPHRGSTARSAALIEAVLAESGSR